MGTRGAYGYRLKQKDKVTYNHFDSYLDGLGIEILEYVRVTPTEKMLEVAKKIKLVQQDKKPTAKQIEACKKYANLNVGNNSIKDWYCLLRDAQGKMEAFEDTPFMIDSQTFLKDSLFCEWAYIVNLDSGCVEIYKGFNQNPKALGRYAWDNDAQIGGMSGNKYYGVALIEEVQIEKIQKMSKDELISYVEGLQKKANDEAEVLAEDEVIPLKMAHSPDHD